MIPKKDPGEHDAASSPGDSADGQDRREAIISGDGAHGPRDHATHDASAARAARSNEGQEEAEASEEKEVIPHSSGKSLQDRENVSCDIADSVQRWNNWTSIVSRSDRENYINGHCEFFFEYVSGTGDQLSDPFSSHIDTPCGPLKIPFVHAHRATRDEERKIWNLLLDNNGIDSFVVTHWGEITMPLRDRCDLDQIQKFVPSRLSVGLEVNDRIEKLLTDEVCESVLYGFVKSSRIFAKRELDLFSIFCGNERANDLPVSEIESGANVAERISRRDSKSVYNGFVLFGENEALAGMCISTNDVRERFLFANNCVYLRDVFRRILQESK
jgi:hypothetical protein